MSVGWDYSVSNDGLGQWHNNTTTCNIMNDIKRMQ